jgi:acyl carrier protein
MNAMDKQAIQQHIARIMQETFEIDPARVTLEARLYDDLEIDSIDAVDLIVQLKPLAGRRLEPNAFKTVRTVGDVVDALHALLNNPTPA